MAYPLQSRLKLYPFSSGSDQSSCLDDLPQGRAKFSFLSKSESLPGGGQVKAIDQCKRAFGDDFRPHVKEDEEPFEVKGAKE